ncbi:MAG: hypothetical protein M0017_12880 [Desulfobacteraceae bacterium]|nr:hypothetical protein [Desulfobacteraceae bacterium]
MEPHNGSYSPALVKAAKYICTQKCGRCPMAVEGYRCPRECSLETVPWECWIAFFSEEKAREPVETTE